jgi:sterol desaturase/sphingolipid hydroxylase (fatty acid hydroxylase superfamily)
LGARPEVIFLFNALMGLQGLVSHFNVDVKAGPINYLLVGTELHRYHHSASIDEAKNYGVLTPFWDLVFGTFVYRPAQLPNALGVQDPGAYPDSNEIAKVLALPFGRN